MGEFRTATCSAAVTAGVPALLAATILLAGCGQEQREPILSGGRELKSWIADLRKPSPQIRRQAVLKLGNAADSDPATAEALAEALQDPDALVRREAIRSVVKLKQPGAVIKQRLESMSRSDGDALARDLAGKAQVRLGGIE
jgi:HEAT repeat protein